MSFDLDNAQVGDMLVCTLTNDKLPKGEELLGKFIVVSKGSRDDCDDCPELTLHVVQSKENHVPICNYVGRNCTFDIADMVSEIATWNLIYRPLGINK